MGPGKDKEKETGLFRKNKGRQKKKRPTCLHCMRKKVAGRKGLVASGLGGVEAPLGIWLKDWLLAVNRRNYLSKKNALNSPSLVHFLYKIFSFKRKANFFFFHQLLKKISSLQKGWKIRIMRPIHLSLNSTIGNIFALSLIYTYVSALKNFW